MAALAAVAHLVGTGSPPLFHVFVIFLMSANLEVLVDQYIVCIEFYV